MTPPPTETASLPLDTATIAGIQSAAINAMPPRPGASDADKAAQRACALAFLAALCPLDAVQAMIAVHIIASHHAAMECFRMAARGDLSMDMHLRIMGKAVALCRMIERSMRDLTQRQGIAVPRRAVARPVAEPAVHAQPAVRAQPVVEVARESAPSQPAVAENRHERRRRERAEQHRAAAGRRTTGGAGVGAGVVEQAMQERLVAEAAARSAASARMVAA